ncbi:ADP-ribosylglycohydrolase family protein [Amycolatopsis sp. YIM 10]|uniref:ADP-ribosylglycohydrolase family protein n=1 Tax=Amycolatopsis sp. YIM 10 TaxID=2653857 RepID=UPI0012903DCD|nr:ADP-ribosylglycohydrolase family protein [Amycolatopsis sp. YIM 10]QFU89319.1 ADP-ribosylglycohydrolase [Amycolatopsis sp. YIM 10]
MRLTWAQPEDLLAHELVQSAAEGTDVTAVRARWTAAGGDPTPAVSGAGPRPASPELRALARTLLDELGLRKAPDESWEALAASLPPAPELPSIVDDRLRGAWTGRAAGCLLGKPVEKIPREGIEEILRAAGRWPLDRWFTAAGLPEDVAARWPWNRRSAPTSLEENIDGMPEDDDLNYPILALTLLEQRGREFTTDDVAQLWLDHLPAGRVFTAERAAYRNVLDARPVPETATHHNPFREWIGALIRADVFGWVSPGDVREAARLACTDARLSHTRNGVYGAMWAAALCSAAMVCDTVHNVLDAAETVVPPGSALEYAVRSGREAAGTGDVRAGLDRLHAEFGELHWVHVLNNAAVIAYALAKGDGEFGPSVSIAVTAGWDTDSAAATVGGVVGAVHGVPEQWAQPLDGRIATSLPGGEQRIADLAARTKALVAR